MAQTTVVLPAAPRPIELYERMYLIRMFESIMEEESKAGRLPGTFHSSVGQEAVAVGACASLSHQDLVVSNHRGHGHFLAKGGDPFKLMAELFGAEEGYSGGKGGTQHVAGPHCGFMGSNGITGGGIPIATGLALALKRQGRRNAVISFFGDGAANQGTFHESLNMAAIWKLPVIFLCENNGWGMSTPTTEVTAGSSIARRGEAYGILYKFVDGNNVEVMHDHIRAALTMIHHEEAPLLIEARTWRSKGHSRSDMNLYRDKGVEQAWAQRDPIYILKQRLLTHFHTDPKKVEDLEKRVESDLRACLERCKKLPPPPIKTAIEKVYATPAKPKEAAPDPSQQELAPGTFTEKAYWQGIQEAMAEAMARDPKYFIFGEDVCEYGGCFKVTRGMLDKFSKDRLVNTPVSEAGIAGICVGASMAGLRPIGEFMFMDFILLALDQLMNHAAKFHYIYNGQVKAPVVMRTPMGGYRGYGATHSQCLDALLMHMPGLRVVTPWSPRDAKGLLATCLEEENPVVFIEHKALYGTMGPIPNTSEKIPLGRCKIVKPGKDLTLCANSYMVTLSLQAAAVLAKDGINAEVIDLRCLSPLDREGVAESAARTQALVVVEESHRTGGWGAEIAASVQELAFGYLDAPIMRVAAEDVPIPSNPILEKAILPSVEKIVAAAKKALEHRG